MIKYTVDYSIGYASFFRVVGFIWVTKEKMGWWGRGAFVFDQFNEHSAKNV